MIRIAQIGIGHDHAIVTMDSILRQKDIFEFVGFCECEDEEFARPTRERMCPDAKEISLEEILNDQTITAVLIETNDWNLTKYTKMALEHNKHVHMDKPGSQNHQEYKDTVLMAKEKNLVFHVGYMYRYNPVLMEIFDNISQIGEIYSVEAHMNCYHSDEKRQWLDHFKGGMLCFLGCHLIDLVYRLQGEPNEVIPLSCATDGKAKEDLGFCVFKYEKGLSFVKTCANELGGFHRRQLVITGSEGTIEVRPLEWYASNDYQLLETEYSIVLKSEDGAKWSTAHKKQKCEPFNRYDTMMASFASFVSGGKENPYTYEYEIKLHNLLMRACGVEV